MIYKSPSWKKEVKVVNESSLSRLWKHSQGHDTGTISAFRDSKDCGRGEKYTLSQNKQRNSQLKAKLLSAGFGVTSIKGTYIENYKSTNAIEVEEDSFFVVNYQDKGDLKKRLIKFGEEFEQDSITFSKASGEYYLISTNKCPTGYPGFGKIGVEVKLGKPIFSENGEFFSKINGRPFVFKEVTDIGKINEELINWGSVSEIRSIKKLAEMPVE